VDVQEGPAEPVPRKRREQVLTDAVLGTSLRNAARQPDFFCCVCCRQLYLEETCPLTIAPRVRLQDVEWPYRQCGRGPTFKNGRMTACINPLHPNLCSSRGRCTTCKQLYPSVYSNNITQFTTW
jgi:hypothetical protein